MRRFIAAAVIVAALASLAVMAGRAQAEDGPTQATATRRFISTDTPGPSPTQGPPTATWVTRTPGPPDCPPLDAYCRKVHLPVLRRDPRPTAIPTATDEPEVVCRERLFNGSFEEGIAGWALGVGENDFKWRVIEGAAVHGTRMLQAMPADRELIAIRSQPISGPVGHSVTKATFAYSWMGISNETLPNRDALYFVVDAKGSSVYYNSFGNDENMRTWRRFTADVTAKVQAATGPLKVGIDALADINKQTRWYIDAVSLEICAWE